ncbi:MAG: DivIVA domain-containing protein [Propionibacteriaceae bacterium]
MEWVFAALAVVVIGLAAFAAAGHLGAMPEVDVDTPSPILPDGKLGAADLRSARFGVQIRGYDMAQVDSLLARLSEQLETADETEIESTTVLEARKVVFPDHKEKAEMPGFPGSSRLELE